MQARVAYAFSAVLLLTSILPFFQAVTILNEYIRFMQFASENPVPPSVWYARQAEEKTAFLDLAVGFTLIGSVLLIFALPKTEKCVS